MARPMRQPLLSIVSALSMPSMLSMLSMLSMIYVLSMLPIRNAHAQSDSARVDQLFLMASSGEVRFRDMVQPAKDSLSAMGETAAIWLSRKLNATDARERLTLADLFEKIGAVAVPYVVPYLDSAGEYMPKNAARCLGRIGDTSATLPLIPQLNNELYAVRSEVATALGKIGDNRATPPLIARLDHEPDSDVRKSCVVALGVIGDTSAVTTVIGFLGDPFYGVRQSAQTALTKMEPLPVAAMMNAVDDLDGIARHGAIVAVGASDESRAQDRLLGLLDDPDPLIRGFAIEGLAVHTLQRARDRVQELKHDESHPFVLAQIARFERAVQRSNES
jgi:HEAT repeat protein